MIKKIWGYIQFFVMSLVVFCIAYMIFAFTYYPKKMERFCTSIEKGALIDNVKKEIIKNNFDGFNNVQDKRILVSDIRTMGTSTCTIYYDNDERVYSTSYMND